MFHNDLGIISISGQNSLFCYVRVGSEKIDEKIKKRATAKYLLSNYPYTNK